MYTTLVRVYQNCFIASSEGNLNKMYLFAIKGNTTSLEAQNRPTRVIQYCRLIFVFKGLKIS